MAQLAVTASFVFFVCVMFGLVSGTSVSRTPASVAIAADPVKPQVAGEFCYDAEADTFEPYFGAPLLQDVRSILTFVVGVSFAWVLEAQQRNGTPEEEEDTVPSKFEIYSYLL
eukprot:TRINITY_DN29630_c0_g1_i1.p2 TRINITY_DN29630_c0_g1~~TRINITY_DN29630_c0_g1_i1.p2  ORF type:complete len:113 (+),score=22.44 TRINITY_DN29630_c0_g1_i1:217-555(+)